MWGKNCSHTCECQNDGICNQFNGFCTCPKGYTGDKCELECPNGQYGLNCSEACRCQNNGTCHHISGECRCAAGFTGPLCTETCPDGKHGQECKQECKCQNNGKCDPHTGVCECPPGMSDAVEIRLTFWHILITRLRRRYQFHSLEIAGIDSSREKLANSMRRFELALISIFDCFLCNKLLIRLDWWCVCQSMSNRILWKEVWGGVPVL